MKLQSPSDLARLVKNARVQRNLTQQDVADAVSITRQSVARLERGNGGTSFDTVLLIIDHLGIHLEAITDRRTIAPAPVNPRSAALAAADALNRRVAPLTDSSTLEVLYRQIRDSLPPVDATLLSELDTSGLIEHAEALLDPATVASIREASRGLTERLAIPGSALITPPVNANSRAAAQAQAGTGSYTATGTE